jgi:oxygen-independent coproporphyrinogen-3 oxidase
MVPANEALAEQGIETLRFATPDSLEVYSAAANSMQPREARVHQLRASRTLVDSRTALEESFFLGLRMNCGVSLTEIGSRFGQSAIDELRGAIDELIDAALLERESERVRLTSRGRLLSNEVFVRFIRDERPTRV